MPDVFLSYSRDDQTTARRFAEGLRRAGISVWWDQTLRSGEAYDQVTEKALQEAGAVVVLWSTTSVNSRWVRAEATQADRNGTLLPVTIAPCKRPIMFELTQTADLSKWRGDDADPAWQAFLSDVRRFVGEPVLAPLVAKVKARSRTPLYAALAVAAVLLIGAGAFWKLRGGSESAQSADAARPAATTSPAATTRGLAVTSVAVMPFANLTGEPGKDFFGDGMAEELINALAKVSGLQVASRTSSFAYKGRNTDMRQIAKELGVATVIEGSIRSAGDRIRLSAQLSNAESGYHLWSETYDRDFKDLFKLQEELTREIVTAYRRTLGVDQLGVVAQSPPTTNLEAYILFLRAQHAMGLNSDNGTREAVALSEQAIALDPGFARAYWSLGLAHSLLPTSSVAEVERNAKRARELDPDIGPELLISVAARRGQWVEAEELFRAQPSSAVSSMHGTSTLWPMGKIEETLRVTHAVAAAAPAVAIFANNLARLYATLGQEQEALHWNATAIARGADVNARRVRHVVYDTAIASGRYDEAAGIAIDFLPPRLRTPEDVTAIRMVHLAMDDSSRRPEAIDRLNALLARTTPADWVVKVFALSWYSSLGALDEAYAVAESLRVQFEKESSLGAWAWLWSRPMSAFRRDARFQPFMTKLGAMAYWEKFGPPDACGLSNGRLTCR